MREQAFFTSRNGLRKELKIAGILMVLGTRLVFAQPAPEYHLIRSIHIGGGGGWDYLNINPGLKRIYVAHDTLVNVLDQVTGDSVGVIANTRGVHGIEFANEFEKGYTTNGRANTLTVFDLKTNRVQKVVAGGDNPDAIIYDPFSKTVFVCNGRSQDASVIDPSNDSILTTIPLDGKPEAPVSDGRGHIFVNIEDKNEVAEIGTRNWNVEHRWKTGSAESPRGISMDTKSRRLFVGCDNALVVLDAENGKVVTQLQIGSRCDGTAFDPGTSCAFASCGDGTLAVVHEESPDSFRILENVPTKRGARTLALDPVTHHIFLPTADYESVPGISSGTTRPSFRVITGTFEVLEVGR